MTCVGVGGWPAQHGDRVGSRSELRGLFDSTHGLVTMYTCAATARGASGPGMGSVGVDSNVQNNLGTLLLLAACLLPLCVRANRFP